MNAIGPQAGTTRPSHDGTFSRWITRRPPIHLQALLVVLAATT
jgi:hypothetical protein